MALRVSASYRTLALVTHGGMCFAAAAEGLPGAWLAPGVEAPGHHPVKTRWVEDTNPPSKVTSFLIIVFLTLERCH